MTLNERIEAAIRRITEGRAPMRIPADETDPDLVLAAAQKRIAELEQKNAELDEAVRVNAEARLNSHRFRDLEAQVAQHPEQLRRVAEAVRDACAERLNDLRDISQGERIRAFLTVKLNDGRDADRAVAAAIRKTDLAAIIAEAVKP